VVFIHSFTVLAG